MFRKGGKEQRFICFQSVDVHSLYAERPLHFARGSHVATCFSWRTGW